MANFARGLQIGGEYGSQFMHNMIAARDEARKQKDWEDQQAYQQDIKDAAVKAGLETRNGYSVTSPDGGQFFVPESARQAYADAGYTVNAAPVNYQEVNVGSRGLGQYAGTEDPMAARVAQTYNDPTAMNDRLQAVALAHSKPQDAAAYGALSMQPLQRAHLQGQNDLLPGQKQLQGFQVDAAERQQRYSQIEDAFHQAVLGGKQGLIDFYAGYMPDGFSAKEKPLKGGGFQLVQVDADGKEAGVIGTFKDEKDLQLQAMKKAPTLMKHALDLQEKAEEKKLWADTTLSAARINAGARSTYVPNYQMAGTLPTGEPVAFDTRTGTLTDTTTGKPLTAAQVKLLPKVTGEKAGKPLMSDTMNAKVLEEYNGIDPDNGAGLAKFDRKYPGWRQQHLGVPTELKIAGAKPPVGDSVASVRGGTSGGHFLAPTGYSYAQQNPATQSRIREIDSVLNDPSSGASDDARLSLAIERENLLSGRAGGGLSPLGMSFRGGR